MVGVFQRKGSNNNWSKTSDSIHGSFTKHL